MAEFPNPVALWRNIATIARQKTLDALMAFERHIRNQYSRQGPRDR